MSSLFLSYRRGDSPDTVKLIHEHLVQRLPRWEIFYDHDSIPLGQEFPETLRAKVASAAAVLVVIGPKWLEILQQRRHEPIDHARTEARLALEAGTNVVPLLVGHAAMPTEADLADFTDLQPLLRRNGRPVRPDPDFDGDLEPIIAYLENLGSGETLIGQTLAGKYTVTAEIGQGGMGVVYLAEQKQPVQRVVAVKLIKPGMDSRDVLARFDAERQALAVMDHPNVARVLDAGVTAQGRPFFVMEFVKGVPITQYCDERKVAPRERLNLFIPVCNAVQHAHQKGIIHRDLKPSNVLVAVVDGKPVPKVIDFGLAKALGHKLTEKTLHTALDSRVGTLEYSSPEQAAGRSFEVDTRSDIYALGVMLYELLTGAPPFTREQLLKIGEEEMRRVIREEEPLTPSKRLSSSGDLPAIAARRGMEPGRLPRLVHGDLDWIVMKCLEKDCVRRYETANQLGQELARFLADEPVQAGPPSVRYRARKFLRRNKGAVIAASLVLLFLVLGIVGTSIGLAQAERSATNERAAKTDAQNAAAAEKAAHDDALARAAAEKAAREMADHRLTQINKFNALLESIFRDVNPFSEENKGDDLRDKLRLSLKDVADKFDESVANDPLAAARMEHFLGTTLTGLGEPARAVELLHKSLKTRESLLGPLEADTLASLAGLASAHEANGNYALAVSLFEDLVARRTKKLGPDDHATLSAMGSLASAYQEDGQRIKALPLFEKTLARMQALFPDHRDTFACMSNLAYAYNEAGRSEEALPLYEKVWEKFKVLRGPAHPDTLQCQNNVAAMYAVQGHLDKALKLQQDNLRKRELVLGPYHRQTLATKIHVAGIYRDMKFYEKALDLFEETLAAQREHLAPDHPDTLLTMRLLADTYQAVGRIGEALRLLEDTLAREKKTLAPDHPSTLRTMFDLARVCQSDGQLSRAVKLFEETLEKRRVKLPPGHPDTLLTMEDLALAYLAAKQPAKAVPLFQENLAERRKQWGEDDPRYAGQLATFALDLLDNEQYAAAEQMLRQCLALRLKTQPNDWAVLETKVNLGESLLGQKRCPEAKELFASLNLTQKAMPRSAKSSLAKRSERLARLLEACGDKADAEKWKRFAILAKIDGIFLEEIHDPGKELTLMGELGDNKNALIYQLRLKAGNRYVIDMVSPNTKQLDPVLELYDSQGKRVAENDDGGGDLNARIIFEAPVDAVYLIRATAFRGSGRGPFTLTVRPKK